MCVCVRPDRDAASQQREFDVGCADLETRLSAGWKVDDLWAAAKKDPFPPISELYSDIGTTPEHYVRGVEYHLTKHID